MGEAARRKRLGFDGRKVGEAVTAALNEDAGGEVWGVVRRTAASPMFYVLDREGTDVRAGMITSGEAIETPHRVVGLVLVRRGEPWLEAMVFDPGEEYRLEIYAELQEKAARIAPSVMGTEPLDGIWHEVVSSTWPADSRLGLGRTLFAPHLPGEQDVR